MICEICGSELSTAEENSRFCGRCGSKAAPDIKYNEEQDAENSGTESAGNYYFIGAKNPGGGEKARKPGIFLIPARIIAVSCLVLLLAACGIFYAVQNSGDDIYPQINLIIEPPLEFEHISFFSDGLALVAVGRYGSSWNNLKYGFIDMTGELVIPAQYDYASDFNDGIAAVYMQKDRGWGFIDKTGELVIPLMYESASNFTEGLAAVCLDGKWGYIDEAGEVIIPFEYRYAAPFIEGYAVAVLEYNAANTKHGIINIKGDITVPFEYDYIYFNEYIGFYYAQLNNKQGLLDKSGNVIVPCVYDLINFNPADGLIYAQQQQKWKILEIKDYEPVSNIIYRNYQGRYWGMR